jgi:D-alanyl-lipoteichoic acid acyltransferase DltB (MBOAT superfamily)
MLFTSGEFLFVFLPVTLIVFFLVARIAGARPAAWWLVLASFAFYGYWRVEHTLLLLTSIAFNYTAGNLILAARAQHPRRARRLLAAAVSVNLLTLAYFKYANFFLGTAADLTGAAIVPLHVVLPLGISFFTFTQIAYLVDVHAGKVVERNPAHYALFVSYFPHLIAGPVLHHAEMMPQFAQPRIYRPQALEFTIGLAFLCLGLVKKVLIADTVAPVANHAFEHVAHTALTPASAWQGLLAYTVQIYFDFSGYSDMAVGLSLLIGVRLPYNFNSPYKATSITDFWRRWHMTLSRFLRDYLYIALGGNRRGKLRRYVNLMITMLLGGLWHGAAWTFVMWGALHGLYLVVHHGWVWMRERAGWEQRASLPGRVAGTALTLACVILAWVFFRATDFPSALRMIESLFGRGEILYVAPPLSGSYWPWIGVACVIALFGKNSQQLIDGTLSARLGASARTLDWLDLRLLLSGALIVLITLLAIIAASRTVTEFIYFNF